MIPIATSRSSLARAIEHDIASRADVRECTVDLSGDHQHVWAVIVLEPSNNPNDDSWPQLFRDVCASHGVPSAINDGITVRSR